MAFIKVKNDTEKVAEIRKYCQNQIGELDYNINCFKRDQECPSDYRDEIHDLEITKKRFLTLLEIVNAGPTENILI